jgi:hypothetical protein
VVVIFGSSFILFVCYICFFWQRAINETLIFHTCGICDREFGLRDCRLLSDLQWELEASDLKERQFIMEKPLRDPHNHTKYEVFFIFDVDLFEVLLILNGIFVLHFVFCLTCLMFFICFGRLLLQKKSKLSFAMVF